jgi:hypothetical protein
VKQLQDGKLCEFKAGRSHEQGPVSALYANFAGITCKNNLPKGAALEGFQAPVRQMF